MADGTDNLSQEGMPAEFDPVGNSNPPVNPDNQSSMPPDVSADQAEAADANRLATGDPAGTGGQPTNPSPTATAEDTSRGSSAQATSDMPQADAQSPTLGSTDADIQVLLAQAEQAIASVDNPIESNVPGLSSYELKDLTGSPASTEKASLELLRDVELDLRIELGRTLMNLEDVLQLRQGSVVPLDKLAGDPVDVYVNGRLVARGEILVLNDNFCVRVAELIASEETR